MDIYSILSILNVMIDTGIDICGRDYCRASLSNWVRYISCPDGDDWDPLLTSWLTHYVSGGPGNIRNNVILVVIIMPVGIPMLLGLSCIFCTNEASYIHQEMALYLVRNCFDLQWILFVLRHAIGYHSILCTWIYPCMVVQASHKIESWSISLLFFVYRQSR